MTPTPGIFYGPRDWPEDAKYDDNGSYSHLCCSCGKRFLGHKRRVQCKKCATAPSDRGPTTQAIPEKI